jgi:hypothetical protein
MLRHRGSSWGGYECGVTGNRDLLRVVYSKSRCGYQKSEIGNEETRKKHTEKSNRTQGPKLELLKSTYAGLKGRLLREKTIIAETMKEMDFTFLNEKFSVLRWLDPKGKLKGMRKGPTTEFTEGRRENGETEQS